MSATSDANGQRHRHGISVVIPAHDEAGVLGACLWSVLSQRDLAALTVVVVANGCTDGTSSSARAHAPLAAGLGHGLHVLELEVADKSEALAAGDDLLDSVVGEGPRVYLDADAMLGPNALAEVAGRLASSVSPLLVAPTPLFVRPRSVVARRWLRAWQRWAGVTDDVVGAGCYAVNHSGRTRWGRFPSLVADDAFVRSRFAPQERAVIETAYFAVELPEPPELIHVLARWHRGNSELRRAGHRIEPRPRSRAVNGLDVAVLAGFGLLSRLPRGRRPRWERARRPVERVTPVVPSVDAIVVPSPSALLLGGCLRSLAESLEGVQAEITIVAASLDDDSVRRAASSGSGTTVVQPRTSTGRAASVNEAAGAAASEFLLLVHPDVRLDAGAVPALIALARRNPEAGIYGGRSHEPSVELDPSWCLTEPSVRQAIAFACGSSMPDLSGWSQEDIREVPALTVGVLLVTRSAWEALGGFDDRFPCGADVDLCVRARSAGFRPMSTPLATYSRQRVADVTVADRWVATWRANVRLFHVHCSWFGGRAARVALIAGVALRAVREVVVADDRRGAQVWRDLWRRRAEWARPPAAR